VKVDSASSSYRRARNLARRAEAALATLDGVRDVAVTGVEDVEWASASSRWVVSDGTEFDEESAAIREERIGTWAKPRDPLRGRNSSHDNGKIQRNALGNLH